MTMPSTTRLGASGRSPTNKLSIVKQRVRVHGRRLSWLLGWHRSVDRSVLGCVLALRPEWLSGGEQGFDGFVAENEEGSHRPETGQERLVAAGVADSADDVFAAEFLQIISSVARTVL